MKNIITIDPTYGLVSCPANIPITPANMKTIINISEIIADAMNVPTSKRGIANFFPMLNNAANIGIANNIDHIILSPIPNPKNSSKK